MSPSTLPHATAKRELVSGLDSLRFFAALSVSVSHLAANTPLKPESAIGSVVWRMIELGANGRVAVALFFVISGFCIHFRQAESLKIDLPEFITRRGVRIGLPLIAVSILATCLGSWTARALQSVLWSIYCELIYYASYPTLLSLRRRYSIERILVLSTTISAMLIFVGLYFKLDAFIGMPTTAYCVPLYPLWLLGAWLAERHCKHCGEGGRLGIASWRAGAVTLCFAANEIRIHELQFAAWLLYAAVGLFCFSYIPKELDRWSEQRPPEFTERLGKSSYSLYLVHTLPIALMVQLNVSWPFLTVLFAQIVAIALMTFCFYMLCELPAHKLARSINRSRTARSTPVVGASAP